MVALVLSIFLLGGMVAMFSSSKGTYETNSRLAVVEENGQLAMSILVRDLRGAGFNGCNRSGAIHNVLLPSAGSLNDFQFGVGGYNNTAGPVDAPFSLAGNDVLIVRSPLPGSTEILTASMASNTSNLQIRAFPVGNPGTFAPNQILMVGNCTESSVFRVSAYDASTGVIAHASTHNQTNSLVAAYGVGQPVLRVRASAYYLRCASNPCAPTERPGLWRNTDGVAEELVEGIDSLHFLYGVDTDNDRDANNYLPANLVTDWDAVISISVGLVASSPEPYGPPHGAITYTVIDHPTHGQTYTAPDDRRIRKLFTSTVALRNNAW